MQKEKNVREKLILAFFASWFLFILNGLYKIQVKSFTYYESLAKNQHWRKSKIPAFRGKIYFQDKFGERIIASVNDVFYSIFEVMPNIEDKNTEFERISNAINFESKEKKEEFKKSFLEYSGKSAYFSVISKGTKEEFNKFEKLNLFNESLRFNSFQSRNYPLGKTGSQILGFVNRENVGNYGIEGYFNEILSEKIGETFGEADPEGRVLSFGEKKEIKAKDGVSLVLTIDAFFQAGVEKILEEGIKKYQAEMGSVVVMNSETGSILAIANYPTFDPNKFDEVAAEENGFFKFKNFAVTESFEPGSSFKPFVMAAAMNEKVVDMKTIIYDNKCFLEYEDKSVVKNALGACFPVQTLTDVIENSSNIGMSLIAERLGKEKTHRYITDFGFGKMTGIPISFEGSGRIKNWKEWLNIDLATISFGQGITVTPIQMAAAGCALANGGKLVLPRLVDTIIDYDIEKKEPVKIVRQVISEETSKLISGILVSSVDNGFAHKGKVEGYAIAGKTGTAEIPNPAGGYFRQGPYNASFLGYGPVYTEKPAPIVVFVWLHKPKSPTQFAEGTAAPLFADVMKFALDYYQIPKNR